MPLNTNQQYVANTGNCKLTTANSNLDGSGAIVSCLTAGGDGCLIVTVSVKALQTTTQGMVRLFIDGGGNTRLLTEIMIPAVTQSGVTPAYGVSIPIRFNLQAGYKLMATTQNSEEFIVTAEGLDWTNCACS